jgi:hypothetical protein
MTLMLASITPLSDLLVRSQVAKHRHAVQTAIEARCASAVTLAVGATPQQVRAGSRVRMPSSAPQI